MEERGKQPETKDGGNELQQFFTSVRDAPAYPMGFRAARNATRKLPIANKQLLEKLRQLEAGEWRKVYSDGMDGDGRAISLHYFQSVSGKVFDVKVKRGWSNKR